MNNITEAALREFAERRYPFIPNKAVYNVSRRRMQKELIEQLTALTSKLFVPKEDHDLILAENRQLKEDFDRLVEDHMRLIDQLDDDSDDDDMDTDDD